MDQNIIIPIFGMLTGIIIPLAVFFWLYHEDKDKIRSNHPNLYQDSQSYLQEYSCLHKLDYYKVRSLSNLSRESTLL